MNKKQNIIEIYKNLTNLLMNILKHKILDRNDTLHVEHIAKSC